MLMNIELSMMSILGTLALIGVVVNDSLLLVDFVNRRGTDNQFRKMRSLLSAGQLRLRPVLLTSLTTFIGLMPLLFDSSTQAQFLKPMAISLGFGILFSTANTLILVPLQYVILDDLKRLFARWWKLEWQEELLAAASVSGK